MLIAPEWVGSIDWMSQSVRVDLKKELIGNCPVYNPEEPIHRDYETVLYNYYGRPYYWEPEKVELFGK